MRGKKRLLIVCLSIILLFAVVNVVLVLSGWYRAPAALQKWDAGTIYRASTEESDSVINFADWSVMSMVGGFYTYDVLPYIGLQMRMTIIQGALTLIIYEDPGEPLSLETAGLTEVDRKTFTESMEYEWDLSDLKKNQSYIYSFFCDEECLFQISDRIVWKPTRAQLLYEKFLTKLPQFPSKYVPIDPAYAE